MRLLTFGGDPVRRNILNQQFKNERIANMVNQLKELLKLYKNSLNTDEKETILNEIEKGFSYLDNEFKHNNKINADILEDYMSLKCEYIYIPRSNYISLLDGIDMNNYNTSRSYLFNELIAMDISKYLSGYDNNNNENVNENNDDTNNNDYNSDDYDSDNNSDDDNN